MTPKTADLTGSGPADITTYCDAFQYLLEFRTKLAIRIRLGVAAGTRFHL